MKVAHRLDRNIPNRERKEVPPAATILTNSASNNSDTRSHDPIAIQDVMIITDNEFVDIPTPIGPMRTHVLCPVAEGRYPGIVLFSEIFQVTGPIRRSAALLAGHGFVVVVPEIFHELEQLGTVLPYDQAGADRGNADKITKELSSYDYDARAALSYLKTHSNCTGKLGVMGFCIGGHLAFRAAMNPEVLAATCCYPTDIYKRSLGKGMQDNSL